MRRPSRAQQLRFLARCLRYAGVLSLAAGVVFFIAANWSRIAVFGRFALLQVVLVALVAFACASRRRASSGARVVPRFHRHRRVARAVRPDVSDRRGCLRAVPDLGVARPAAGDRRAMGRCHPPPGCWCSTPRCCCSAAGSRAAASCGRCSTAQRFNTTHAILVAATLNVALWIAAEQLAKFRRARMGTPARSCSVRSSSSPGPG